MTTHSPSLLYATFFLPMITTGLLGVGAIFKVSERFQTRILAFGMQSSLFFVGLLSAQFITNHFEPMQTPACILFQKGEYEFSLSLYLDRISWIFLVMTLFFGNIVAFFSHRYIHRELGFRRFFFIISFFIFGMSLAVLSSNLDSLFAGWEIVGISSYLLIAYYLENEKPVQNAERVYWVYRICDLGLLLGAFFTHVVWKKHLIFSNLEKLPEIESIFQSVPLSYQWTLGALIALAALGKSAQFPFLTWLPRALEGPTPSTAIFYGALSIHLGLYLLMRMEPIWRLIPGFALFLGCIGLLSATLASTFGRLQTTIKGQIAYASSAQVGMMFLELALGLHSLAILHFTANALYRGYQLLTAPSIVVEQLHLQSALGGEIYRTRWLPELFLPRRFSESIFLFSLNEGYIDALWLKIGRCLHRVLCSLRQRWLILSLLSASIGILFLFHPSKLPIVAIMLLHSLLFSHAAYEEKRNSFIVVSTISLSQLLLLIATGLLNPDDSKILALCLFTFGIGAAFSFLSLYHISRCRNLNGMNHFHGLFHSFPRTAALFFISATSIIGSPVVFTFVAEDYIFHRLVPQSGIFALLACITFVLNGVTLIRLYGTLFLGNGGKYLPKNEFSDLSPKVAIVLFCLFLGFQWIPFVMWRYGL